MFDSVLPGRGRPRRPRTTPLGGQRRFAVATPPRTADDPAGATPPPGRPVDAPAPDATTTRGGGPAALGDDASGRGRLQTLVRGREGDPAWIRPTLLAVLAGAALLLLWNLSGNGYSNTYYAAAVKSASVSWKALFFGSLDPGSFITVDKPPLSIWLMGLSTRVLGFGSFTMLLPQALCTVAAVGLLHATVRRALQDRLGSSAAAAAGLLAAALLAITPITVAIGRVNNPDALLILLLVASAYATMRAVEGGRTTWLVWAGVFVGLAFMTKMLQGWMIVPALGAVYLLAGPPKLLTRIRQLAIAGVVMAVVSAAWPTAVSLWPGSKPYIGGSDDGSAWNLILGYNGLGRITGNEGGMGGGGGGPTFGGTAGIWRMFNEQVGAQIAWLLPLSALSLVAALWLTRRAPRTDKVRAVIVLLGVWMLVHALVFSTAKGIFHPYYTSAMAPAIAGLSAVGLVLLFRAARTSVVAHVALAVGVAGTAWLSVELLGRAADFQPWLRVAVPVLAGLAVLASVGLRRPGTAMRRLAVVAAVTGVLAVAVGPASYAVASAGRSLNGNNVLAGPASASQGGMGGPGGMRGGGQGGPGGRMGTPPSGTQGAPPSGAPTGGAAPSGTAGSGSAASGNGSSTALPPGTTTSGGTGSASAAAGQGGPGGGGGGMGGGSVSDEVVSYLEAHQGSAKYLFAASGSQTTADVIIETGKPVVTIGGFSGSDNSPTVAQLAQMVRSGELKYVLVSSGGGRGGPGGGGSSDLTTWVQQHGKAVTGVTVSGGTLYAVSTS
ncbi:glycosyltransferase family 39 protein [Patulibacter minatonensis]|uniref:glycosyltransferase family 39 protein n=1 Tax=Patulibacter minatonensis TaxID=298163 RepID=UPI0004B7EBFD|nr:glycosyltransferase family 39 protein [Patulibacter minatonensis]